ncbi:MAG: hypothetical protein HJJLKODD_02908 [Phycisphaerae bacterium]|nr:hypothetical protein [Phycisphaerae bacterium]
MKFIEIMMLGITAASVFISAGGCQTQSTSDLTVEPTTPQTVFDLAGDDDIDYYAYPMPKS